MANFSTQEFGLFNEGGNGWKKIVETDLLENPQFLRFSEVVLNYSHIFDAKPIEEKCHLVVNYLQPQKKTLNVTNLIHFVSAIDENEPCNFSNHSQLVKHLQTELLPICGSSRGYKFSISFFSEAKVCTELIASILQMDPIERCSTLEICLQELDKQIQLPVEAISNWLHRKHEGINGVTKECFLKIYSSGTFSYYINDIHIQNAMEMCDYLKEVVKI